MKLNELDNLIPQYAMNKQELESYKKICDKENGKIKSIMADFALQKYETDGYRAIRRISKRETINEDTLISLFTTVPAFTEVNDTFNIIKMKPYVDYDALENALYNNVLTQEQIAELDKAKETKEVVSLMVSKIRAKKEDE